MGKRGRPINLKRQIAIQNGDITFEGSLCKKGHTTRYTLDYKCVECHKAKKKEHRKTKQGKKVHIRSHFKMKYGIDEYGWLRMYKEQDGKCLTCDTTSHARWWEQGFTGFCVDHCHITGKVRGLLCQVCNKLTGQIEKDHQRLHKIIDHIDYHSEPGQPVYHVGYESYGKILSRMGVVEPLN